MYERMPEREITEAGNKISGTVACNSKFPSSLS